MRNGDKLKTSKLTIVTHNLRGGFEESDIEDFKNLPIFYNVSERFTHVTVGHFTYEATFSGNIFSIINKLPFQYDREKYLLKFYSLILEIK